MQFEWDENKNKKNKAKHGVDFTEIQKLWEDVFALIFNAKQDKENRKLAIGRIGQRVYAVIFIWRNSRVRLISARPASKKEVEIYENYSRKS